MSEILIKTLQLILSLSLLVIIHEFGHFLFARLFKTRVEKFYLFFDPWFAIFKKKIGETEYGIGWLPLGGYVKISGMIDESMDKEQMKQPPQPYEFRSKKTWQRLLIMIAGVLFNVILAFVIYMMILFVWGEKYLPASEVKYGIMTDSLGQSIGLRNGDKIISLDNKPVDNFRKIMGDIVLENVHSIQVLRNDSHVNIIVPNNFIAKLINDKEFLEVRIPFIVEDFAKNSVAQQAGLKKGDRVIAINDTSVTYFDEVRSFLMRNKNREILLTVLRNNDSAKIKLKLPETGMLGVSIMADLEKFFKLKQINYGFFEAIPAGFNKTFSMLDNYMKQLKLIFSPQTKAYESLGGFISIGKIFPSEWDWFSFWSMSAFLSIVLAIMNLLPIPGLDGGHVLFLLYEIVTGRKPSDKFLERAQIFGMIILLALLIYANGNDIIKLFK